MSQLALPIALADHAVFSSFYTEGNETLVATLQDIAAGRDTHGCWIWGAPASGKSHLLQAVCDAVGDSAVYLPMSSIANYGAAALDGLERRPLICVDDIEAVTANREFEQALFSLINRLYESNGQMIVAANSTPRATKIELPDLASRFSRLPVFQIQTLSDDGLVAALKHRAEYRGLSLTDDAAKFVVRRCRRDMATLTTLLDRLDNAGLKAKRRLTLPFVRDAIRDQTGEVSP